MKNKEIIKKFLQGKGWTNKGEICNHLIISGGGYADTIGRQLRKYAEQNKPYTFLKSRPNPYGKGTEYKLLHDGGYDRLQEIIKRRKEAEDPNLNLFSN